MQRVALASRTLGPNPVLCEEWEAAREARDLKQSALRHYKPHDCGHFFYKKAELPYKKNGVHPCDESVRV